MSNQQLDMAAQLHQWALKEMHFRPQGRFANQKLPTEDDFRQICRGHMVDVWKFVLKNVHSAQTVRKVHGNLTLKAKQDSKVFGGKQQGNSAHGEERSDLIEKRRQLSAQLTSTLSAIGHVDRDLDRLKKDILHTESEYQKVCCKFRDLQRRSAILQAHSKHVQGEVDKHDEYTQRIRHKVDTLSALAKKGTDGGVLYSRHTAGDSEANTLETACTRNVRETCEHIGSFLHHLLKGDFSDDKNLMVKRKEGLWQKTEAVCREFPVNQLLNSLCINTHDSTISLKERTARIDIRKDAEKLRFKYEKSGELRDVSTQDTVLQSVHQLLEEAHASNIKRFIETEKCKNNSWKLQQRLHEASEMLDTHLKHRYKDDPGALELARKLLQSEVQGASDRAALRTLQDKVECLKDQISQGMREKEMLFAKYQKIQDFGKLADSKQGLIHVLVKQNVSARSRLETQQQEIVAYIQQSLCEHESSARATTAALENCVSGEVDDFTKLHLPALVFSLIDSAYKVAVIDLSINRLNNNYPSAASETLQKVINFVEFPSYKGCEELLPTVMKLLTEAEELESSLHSERRLDERAHSSSLASISKLCSELALHDEKQLASVLPMLQKRLAHSTQALTHCLQVKDTAAAWWEQPGQHACGWMRVDDMSLRQWRDKWTVAVTRLRQIKLTAPKS